MKKIFTLGIFCLVLIGLVSVSFANPFLACDPMTSEVIQIDVELNGQTIHVPAANIDKRADAWLLVDLATIQGGSYTVKARALYGQWGDSDWSSDFLFVKPVITVPAAIRLEAQ
jgi:hypothetical protein